MNDHEKDEPLIEVDATNPNWVHAVVMTAAIIGVVAVIWICCNGAVQLATRQ